MVTIRPPAVPPLLTGLWTIVCGRDRPPAAPGRLLRSPLLTAVCILAGLGAAAFVHYDLTDLTLAGPTTAVRLALATAVAAPLTLLPRRPLLAWRLAMIATLLNLPLTVAPEGLSWPWHPAQTLALPVLVLFVALRHCVTTVFWAGLVTAAAMAVHLPAAQAPVVIAFVVLCAVVGDQIRRRVEAQHNLTAERKLTEAEQARRVVLEERARIAREMHDVVAHHMSLIALRAETAPYRLFDQPETRDAEFAEIAGASRAALNDMRRLLGVLRSDPDTAPSARSPGLAEIPAMIEAAGAAGVDVSLEPAGSVTATPVVEECAYRIVQEGISNATRHAPGAAIRVTLTTDGRTLQVRVHNTEPDLAGSPAVTGLAVGGPRSAGSAAVTGLAVGGPEAAGSAAVTGLAVGGPRSAGSAAVTGLAVGGPRSAGSAAVTGLAVGGPRSAGSAAVTSLAARGPKAAGSPAGSTRADGGHGIAGMRERVGALGGALTTGPKDRGYEVSAVLPLHT
ncbi:histidine kinase [Actinoplanes sp. NPDC048967]|uniref:histidine kinase n=1 Tax=Actinoplanes sp. NPDC048967 TaxID=3155269 RepID=UPI0033F391CC